MQGDVVSVARHLHLSSKKALDKKRETLSVSSSRRASCRSSSKRWKPKACNVPRELFGRGYADGSRRSFAAESDGHGREGLSHEQMASGIILLGFAVSRVFLQLLEALSGLVEIPILGYPRLHRRALAASCSFEIPPASDSDWALFCMSFGLGYDRAFLALPCRISGAEHSVSESWQRFSVGRLLSPFVDFALPKRRVKKFVMQMIDALGLMSNGHEVRSFGHVQALGLVDKRNAGSNPPRVQRLDA